jgi:hypothetical protein
MLRVHVMLVSSLFPVAYGVSRSAIAALRGVMFLEYGHASAVFHA